MNRTVQAHLKNAACIVTGALLYAMSLSFFLEPFNMAPGGVSGISIIVNHLLPSCSVGLLYFLFNLPLIAVGLVFLKKGFMLRTVAATLLTSFISDRFAALEAAGRLNLPLTADPLAAAFAGGVLMGVGIGLTMQGGGSSGGTDIISRVIRLRNKHLRTGTIFLLLDAGIIAASALVFRNLTVAIYAVIADVFCSILLDKVLYGLDAAKNLTVVSDRSEAVAAALMEKLETGVTFLHGEGAYTGTPKKVIMLVLHRQQFTQAREIIRELDKDAFLIVSDATEIYGEGYKAHYDDDL